MKAAHGLLICQAVSSKQEGLRRPGGIGLRKVIPRSSRAGRDSMVVWEGKVGHEEQRNHVARNRRMAAA
jgi:hypothetical protein